MHELDIVGVEDGFLTLVSEDGDRFRVRLDDRLRGAVRPAIAPAAGSRSVSPKDIQAQIRSGLSAAEVAELTGASLEYVERFEGPVMAEREYVITSALAVPVHTADADPAEAPATFGAVIAERLAIIGGEHDHWTSWKDGADWILKLGYDLGTVEHDARWTFDPKRQSLSPINAEAVGLSRVEPPTSTSLPRLRAVPAEEDAAPNGDRFDSGAFRVDGMVDSGPVLAPIGHRPSQPSDTQSHNQTADLLDALRRRRGERDSVDFESADFDPTDQPRPAMRLVELDLDVEPAPVPRQSGTNQHATSQSGTGGFGKRRGRPALPSWDEIVFGAKPDDFDDDLA